MLDDFRGGKKPVQIRPINDLSTPKLPDFDTAVKAYEPSDTLPSQPTPLATPIQSATSPPKHTPPLHPEHRRQRKFFVFKWRHSKRMTSVMVIILLLLISGLSLFALQSQPPQSQGGRVSKKNPTFIPKVQPIVSNLTGLPVEAAVNKRPVTGVMIENSKDARPQSGLDQAGIVFEAIAEGGITRFLALFQDNAPDYVGPIRSARPYYVQWCMSFDCALAHVGGSPEALTNIRQWATKDLDQPYPGAYRRITSRFSPHNMYGSVPKFNELEASKGYGASVFTALNRKIDAASKTPNASQITVNISSAVYNSSYTFDATTNSYARNQNGAPHTVIDAAGTATQLKPKAIIVMIMNYSVLPDKHSVYGTLGSGQAFVFQDGTVTQATWNKPDIKSNLSLVDSTGKSVPLNAGQSWFVALSDASKLSYN